jgi:gamma-glutamyl:cysteine ligase YbdK (ATP-grasp superfamily)
MGKEVESKVFTGADRHRHREKIRQCLDTFAAMLAERVFDFERPHAGMELELHLVDDESLPAMKNLEVLERIADPDYFTELGRFNVEINVSPRQLLDHGLDRFEADVRASLNRAQSKAREAGANLVVVGLLPTLTEEHFDVTLITPSPRYRLMNEQILASRGEHLRLAIEGRERLDVQAESILPEAACASTQFHLQVSPNEFASYWNAAQCVSGVQVALGANSPFFLGRRLWAETRIAVFEQATDTRSEELRVQGVRPRVWFGERWITSVFDLFEENVRYFPAILPICEEEDPQQVFEAGGTPELAELRLHNGTIWRWNRPIYDVVDGQPHLRVENRVLPAGPTIVDTLANGAFYYGVVTALARADRPLWSRLSFSTAEANFHSAARDGLNASVYWPGIGDVPVTELVLRTLLPLAAEGLDSWGVSSAERDRLLTVIERRCLAERNGATWQAETVEALEAGGRDRPEALREMLGQYAELMHTNEPVHTWPVGHT